MFFLIYVQYQYRMIGVVTAQLLDQFDPVLARHVVIDDGDVPRHATAELDDFTSVPGFADNGNVRLGAEHLFQALPDHRVIIGDENLHAHVRCNACSPAVVAVIDTGSATVTRVP